MNKFRFKGLSSFDEKDSEYFFQRNEIIEKLVHLTSVEQITVLHSKTGVGKSSVLKAGLIPRIRQNKCSIPVYFSIENYIKDNNQSIFESVKNSIKQYIPNTSYIDKVIHENENLWYILKKIESTEDKEFFFIFDQFENFFSYPEKEQLNFKNQLYELLYEQIPSDFRNEINYLLSDNPNLLTETGFKKLFERLKIKLIISIRSDKLNQLEYFKDKMYSLTANMIELPVLTQKDAASILKKTSTFVPKYNIDNNFESEPFVISSKLLKEIIDFLSKQNKNEIETYQIQIIGSELERISINSNTKVVDSSLIDEISSLYNNYYESIVEKIKDPIQQTSARKFIENELIFEYENRKLTVYEGVATQKYEINQQTLDFLTENQLINIIFNQNNEKFIELSHDAIITPVLLAKEKRIHKEIRIAEELELKKRIEEQSLLEKEKTARNRKIAIIFSVLFVFSLIMSIMFIIQNDKAQKNQKLALSNLYASYSFQKTETDPTISLRLAEKAYFIDNQNNIAQKAFFNAFYKTNIFYGEVSKINKSFVKAFFTPDASKVMLLSKNKIFIIDLYGNLISELEKKRDVLSVDFSFDNNLFLISTNDSIITIYDSLNNVKNKYSLNSLGLHAAFSPDNKHIIVACSDNNLYLFDIIKNESNTFKGHSDQVIFSDFSDDGTKIVSTSLDNSIILWDINGKIINQHIYVFEQGFSTGVIDIAAISPDSSYICFALNDFKNNNYLLKIWDWKNNIIINRISVAKNIINSIQFIDNQNIMISSDDNNIYICDLFGQDIKKLIGHKNSVSDVVFSSTDKTVYSISSDNTIKSWKIFEHNNIFRNQAPEIFSFCNKSSNYVVCSNNKINIYTSPVNISFSADVNSFITDICISENDNYKCFIDSDNRLLIFDKDLSLIYENKFDKKILKSFISEKKNQVVCVGNKVVCFYDIIEKKLHEIPADSIITADIDFEKGNIIFCNDSMLKVIDFKGKLLFSNPIKNVFYLKYLKHNKNIFIATNNKIIILDKEYEVITEIETNGIIGCDVSKSGKLISWFDNSGNCYLVNKNGDEIFNFKTKNFINKVQFSPNEKSIYISTYNLYGKIEIIEKFVSITDMIEYINNVKLFGLVYNPSETEFENLINN